MNIDNRTLFIADILELLKTPAKIKQVNSERSNEIKRKNRSSDRIGNAIELLIAKAIKIP